MPVGRSAELGRLDAVLRSAIESGRGAVVSVAGAAGVGRSTLLDAMETMATTHGLAVRSVRADRLAQGLPLSVASELMGTDTPVSVVNDGAAHRGFDATPLSHAATAEILQAAEQTAEQPTVLVVNDLQWADRWSLLVLGRIAQIALDRPLVLVLGVLSAASFQRLEVVDLLSVGQEVTGVRIDLEPLDRTATFELARRHLGDEPGPVLRRMIDRSGGSPLLVIELLAASREPLGAKRRPRRCLVGIIPIRGGRGGGASSRRPPGIPTNHPEPGGCPRVQVLRREPRRSVCVNGARARPRPHRTLPERSPRRAWRAILVRARAHPRGHLRRESTVNSPGHASRHRLSSRSGRARRLTWSPTTSPRERIRVMSTRSSGSSRPLPSSKFPIRS